jgi:hypothetical protein
MQINSRSYLTRETIIETEFRVRSALNCAPDNIAHDSVLLAEIKVKLARESKLPTLQCGRHGGAVKYRRASASSRMA